MQAHSETGRRLDLLDLSLVGIFLIGLYLGVALPITAKMPITCIPSGVAGLILLWRRREEIERKLNPALQPDGLRQFDRLVAWLAANEIPRR